MIHKRDECVCGGVVVYIYRCEVEVQQRVSRRRKMHRAASTDSTAHSLFKT